MEQNVVSVSGTTKELRISAASSGSALPATGTSTLFTVTFQAAPATGPASSPLLLSLADLNESAVSVTTGSVKLAGESGAMTLSPDPVKPSRDVTVTPADADLNTDPASAKSVSVTINSETGGGATKEWQSVTLTQTGVNTGTFTATITTVFGVSATAGGAFDAAGDAGTSVTDSIDVVAGVDGTASTSPAQVNGGDLVTVTVVDPDQASAGTRIIGAPFTISSTLENTTEQGRGKNRRSETAFVLPTLYQIALHGRWEASGDRNADLLRFETGDIEDVGAYLESKEDMEIKGLMSGAYPEHMSLEVGERSATKAYVTAQSFGVDSLGAPQSARLSWEALGRGGVLNVWGAEVRSAGAPARALQREAAVMARWAPAPFFFEPGSAKLVKGDGSRIDALAEFMTSVPAVRVRIEGHADIDPIFNANYYSYADLSADRAEILSKKLQRRGIAAERIEVVGPCG